MKKRRINSTLLFFVLVISGASHAQYVTLIESDLDTTGGTELAVTSYSTYDDLINWNPSISQFSAIDLSAGYTTTGLTYDGDYYRLLIESDLDTAGGTELAVISYATYDDLINWNPSISQFSAIDLSAGYTTTGLTYDGDYYRLLIESDLDTAGGTELAVISYATYDDLINWNPSISQFSAIDLSAGYTTTGLTYIPEVTEHPVPEAGALAMLSLGLLGLGIIARRQSS